MFDFESMSKKKRDLYECMWGSSEFDFPVEKTVYRGTITPNSYTFSDTSSEEEDVCRARLAEIFKIANNDLFKQKFSQSISGSGQELKRIATVHSSSLCALLFFYNVSEANPYIMEIEEDFDGTLCRECYPEVGVPNMKLINFLINRRVLGDKLILWTCREDKLLEDAIKWCRQLGLEFDAVNDNLPETIALWGNNSRKITADLYIDDRSEKPWTELLQRVC